jgi:NAD(P)-dependent dehydrogenase (short-subunit alcohol dehydrogenase family)
MGSSESKPQTKYFADFKEGLPSLAEKTVAVTGCTSGTGFVLARTSIEKGAKNVLLLNRPSERATSAENELKAFIQAGSATTVETIACDLQDFESVKSAANLIKSKYEAIDVLCNNAGLMALGDVATKDGYDIQIQTNHLSHFLLTRELFPLLQRAKELRGTARVVHHSSLARHGADLKADYFGKNGGNLGGNGSTFENATFRGGRWERYHQTKLANSVMTMALKDRFGNSGIIAAVAAPGLSSTNLQTTSKNEGGMANMFIMKLAQSAEDGTMPLLAACFDPSTENGDFWEPSQGSSMYGPAVKVPWDKASLNEQNRKLLWDESEKACGKFVIELN